LYKPAQAVGRIMPYFRADSKPLYKKIAYGTMH